MAWWCSFSGDITYVNLLLNPEKYTGYTGVSAQQIWEAVYNQNCFKGCVLTLSIQIIRVWGQEF
jgi:hypothetical protein